MCIEYGTKAEIIKGINILIKQLNTITKQNAELIALMKKQNEKMDRDARK